MPIRREAATPRDCRGRHGASTRAGAGNLPGSASAHSASDRGHGAPGSNAWPSFLAPGGCPGGSRHSLSWSRFFFRLRPPWNRQGVRVGRAPSQCGAGRNISFTFAIKSTDDIDRGPQNRIKGMYPVKLTFSSRITNALWANKAKRETKHRPTGRDDALLLPPASDFKRILLEFNALQQKRI
jgi:hypothetical protein